MVVGIELARAMEPLTFFQMEVFNTQSAIRYKSATQLNTLTYCEKTRYFVPMARPVVSDVCLLCLFYYVVTFDGTRKSYDSVLWLVG